MSKPAPSSRSRGGGGQERTNKTTRAGRETPSRPSKYEQGEFDDDEPQQEEKEQQLNNNSEDENEPSSTTTTTTTKHQKRGFRVLDISEELVHALVHMGFRQPTPIQRRAIPPALIGRDVVAMARTGSGKTVAFLIPLIEKLRSFRTQTATTTRHIRGLVISPTRELTQQTHSICLQLSRGLGLSYVLLQGGDSMEAQFDALSAAPDAIIATPGRLAHVLVEVGDNDLDLTHVEMVIFDEADRLFEMGFSEQIKEILNRTPASRQTLLFSATLPRLVAEFTQAKLRDPELIRLDTETRVSETLKMAFFLCRHHDKLGALLSIMSRLITTNESSIVFCATKHEAELVTGVLRAASVVETSGESNEYFGVSLAHGSMEQEARVLALERFRKNRTRVLVVTDLAARGLDIPHVNNVVNFSFPDKAKLFIHRVGRAARQGRPGTAFSLVGPDETGHLMDVFLFLGRSVHVCNGGNCGEGDDSNTPHVGCVPQALLDVYIETASRCISNDGQLQAAARATENGHKAYIKTRSVPSKRSIKRAKEELNIVVGGGGWSHHLFGVVDTTREKQDVNSARSDIQPITIEALSKFRPSKTTFENIEQPRGTDKKRKQAAMNALELAKKMRKMVSLAGKNNKGQQQQQPVDDDDASIEPVTNAVIQPHVSILPTSKPRISRVQRKKMRRGEINDDCVASKPPTQQQQPVAAPGEPSGAFKSPHFLSTESSYSTDYEAQLGINRLQDAVLDLVPDDGETMARARKTYKWDERKRKYIQATLKDHVEAKRVKSESGGAIDTKNRGKIYEKWQKQSKRRLNDPVEAGSELHVNVKKNAKTRKAALARTGKGNKWRKEDNVLDESEIVKKRLVEERKKGRGQGGGGGAGKRLAGKDAHHKKPGGGGGGGKRKR